MIGLGMINQMVDTLVSPAGIMLMMEQGSPQGLRLQPRRPHWNDACRW
jgi:hypothetical protein